MKLNEYPDVVCHSETADGSPMEENGEEEAMEIVNDVIYVLPDEIWESIFSYLGIEHRCVASAVCREWNYKLWALQTSLELQLLWRFITENNSLPEKIKTKSLEIFCVNVTTCALSSFATVSTSQALLFSNLIPR